MCWVIDPKPTTPEERANLMVYVGRHSHVTHRLIAQVERLEADALAWRAHVKKCDEELLVLGAKWADRNERLRAEIERLKEENERLRAEVKDARERRHRCSVCGRCLVTDTQCGPCGRADPL